MAPLKCSAPSDLHWVVVFVVDSRFVVGIGTLLTATSPWNLAFAPQTNAILGSALFYFHCISVGKEQIGHSPHMRWMSGLIQIMFVTVSAAFGGSEGSLYI